MTQIDGNGSGPGRGRRRMLGQRQRALEKSLCPDEVVAEVWTERIAPPRCPVYPASPFADQGIVQQRHDGVVISKLCNGVAPDHIEEHGAIDTVFFKEAIESGPVDGLLPAGGDHPGDGMASEAEHRGGGQLGGTAKDPFLTEGRAHVVKQILEVLAQGVRRFFFRGEGGGFVRRRTSWQ